MKNKFGFIPIVLPVLVMVLIIGLINLTGPQTAQAQQAGNVDEVDARLSALTLTVGMLSPVFAADVANYTAKVDNTVPSVDVTGTPAESDYTATYSLSSSPPSGWSISGNSVTLGVPGTARVTVTVTVTEDGATAPKTATYVIGLTKMQADVHLNGPRLTSISISGISDGDLMRKYGPNGFHGSINYYTASLDYDVQSVTVDPTEANTEITSTISPGKVGLYVSSETEHRVPLSVGDNIITVSTKATGSDAVYTFVITRQAPELGTNGIDLVTNLAGDTDPEFTYSANTRTYDVTVGYEVDSTTVVADPSGETRRVVKSITPSDMDDSTEDDLATLAVENHDIRLTSGETSTIVISVDHWLATERSDDEATVGSTSTGKYTVNIKREQPKLGPATADASDGLQLQYGVNTVPGENVGTDGGFGLDPVYDPDTTAYKATVPYQYGFVTIVTSPQTASPPGETLAALLTGQHSMDARPGINGYQVELAPGVTKTVTVTARSATAKNSKTDYNLALTRDATPLDSLALCEGDEATCEATNADAGTPELDGEPLAATDITDPQIGLMPPGTSTPHEFNSATSTYSAVVNYAVNSVTTAASNTGLTPATNREISISTSSAGYKAVEISTANLVVGDNEIGVRSGVPGNTSTYEVTVRRESPKPMLMFTLVDGNNIALGVGTATLVLDAQSNTYNLQGETGDAFSNDDLLLMDSIRVSTGALDVGVRVSSDQVTVPLASAYLEIPNLPDGNFSINFEVRYKTGDGDAEDATTHIINVSRPVNAVPMFDANDPLDGREIVLLHGEQFSPLGINPPVTLPHASGGNGDLSYMLMGDEAKGTARIPADLGFDLPQGRSSDGQLTGVPRILDESDAATHYLVLKVSDSDALTGGADEDTINFSIRIVRDRTQVTQTPVVIPDLAELFDIEVRYREDGETKTAKLSRDFDPDYKSYSATVPTDVDDVDIHVLASSSAEVLLQDKATSVKVPGVTRNMLTGTQHQWNGHKIALGSVAPVNNVYTIGVGDGDAEMDYSLNVIREGNTPARFASNTKLVRKYYEGIELNDINGYLAHEELPVAMGGNGASSTWMYSLARRLDTAPEDAGDFLGLTLMNMGPGATGEMPPYLMGTPDLDTGAQDRDIRRLSDHSEVYALYSVKDKDKDVSAGDGDTLDVDIYVYRNLALKSYTVDGVTVSDLDTSTRMYRDSRTYRYSDTDIKTYTVSVAHNATMATVSANAWDTVGADVSVTSPADADAQAAGHQVSLSPGANEVTITVENGAISATHVLNLSRPGLQATSIVVREDEDERTDRVSGEGVKLSPAFDREVTEYTAMVETWVRSVQIEVEAADPNARLLVNAFEIQDPPGYAVVNVPNIGDASPNVITVGVQLGSAEPEDYTVSVTRKADTAPAFAEEMEDLTRTVDRKLKYAIELPKAEGGNGDPVYSVIDEELPTGLTFDAATRKITGMPTLDEGYSSDFEVTYMVADSDGNTAASDGDSMTFTITITHDDVSEMEVVEDPIDPADRNKLSDLIVTYDQPALDVEDKVASLSPAFSPDSGGPYSVNVPHDGTNVQVTTVPAVTEAVIAINNVRIAGGVKLDLPPVARIVVTHPELAGEMVYTLNTVGGSDTAPSFGDTTVEDMTYVSDEEIDPMTLPTASGGEGAITYSLMDHEGRTAPEGLEFTAGTRTLSGTPTLLRDAIETTYRMTYMATDENGDSDSLAFMITVCDADEVSGCSSTVGPVDPDPEPMPITDLTATRSADGMSVDLEWPAVSGATRHIVFLISGASLEAEGAALEDYDLITNGSATTHSFSGLDAAQDYTIVLVSGTPAWQLPWDEAMSAGN